MSLHIGIVDSTQVTSGDPAVRHAYAVRVVRFAAGAKIGFDGADPKGHRTLYGNVSYSDDNPFDVFTSGGQVVLEYVTTKALRRVFDGPPGTAAPALDANNFTQVTGANGDGTAAGRVEAGVMVAGRDQSGEKRTLSVGNLDSGLLLGALVFPVRDKTASSTAILGALSGPGGGGVGYPIFTQKHPASASSEKGYVYANVALTAGGTFFILGIKPGATLHTYIRKLVLTGVGHATAAALGRFYFVRATAFTGGTADAPAKTHSSLAAFSGSILRAPTARTLPGTPEFFGSDDRVIPATTDTSNEGEIVYDFEDDAIRLPGGSTEYLSLELSAGAPAGWTGCGVRLYLFERSY